MGLGLGGHVARIASVAITGQRVHDIADELQRGFRLHRVDPGGVEVGDQQHVGLVDGLEAPQAGAVEALAAFHKTFLHVGRGYREVLPTSNQVGDEEVDTPHVVVRYQFLYIRKAS